MELIEKVFIFAVSVVLLECYSGNTRFHKIVRQYDFWVDPPNMSKPSFAHLVSPCTCVMKWDQREHGICPNMARASQVFVLMLKRQTSFKATFAVCL